MLLGMQGIFADYERTKIAERTRRGKLFWAQQGAQVGGHAAFGYRFVKRTDQERARLEVVEPQASIVRRMFAWLVDEQLSTRAIARRLTGEEIPTSRGAVQWQPTVGDRMLRNPTYRGAFYYQRNRSVLPATRLSTDRYRQRRKTGRAPRPQEDWITIPVPAIVNDALWEAAQAQLVQNSLHSRRNNKRHEYLLRGLVRCPRCGGTYTGHVGRGYRYYRCSRTDASLSSTGQRCTPGSVPASAIEESVWQAVTGALLEPAILRAEFERRIGDPASTDLKQEGDQVAAALRKLQMQEKRVTEAYVQGAMDLVLYKAEMAKIKRERLECQKSQRDIERRGDQQVDARDALSRLESFCADIVRGLDRLSFEERQRLLRLLVERITVDQEQIRIDTVIPLGTGTSLRSSDLVDGTPSAQLRTRRPELVEG